MTLANYSQHIFKCAWKAGWPAATGVDTPQTPGYHRGITEAEVMPHHLHPPSPPRSPLLCNPGCGWRHFKHPTVLMLHTDSCSRTVTGSARLLITELTHRAAMYFGPRSQNSLPPPNALQQPLSYIMHAPDNSVAICIGGVVDITFHKRQYTLKVFLRLTFQNEFLASLLEKKPSANAIWFCLCLQKSQREYVKEFVRVFLWLRLCNNSILSSLSNQSQSEVFQM